MGAPTHICTSDVIPDRGRHFPAHCAITGVGQRLNLGGELDRDTGRDRGLRLGILDAYVVHLSLMFG